MLRCNHLLTEVEIYDRIDNMKNTLIPSKAPEAVRVYYTITKLEPNQTEILSVADCDNYTEACECYNSTVNSANLGDLISLGMKVEGLGTDEDRSSYIVIAKTVKL